MPMDFPNMDSLKKAARVHKFRQPNNEETEEEYRTSVADHVASIDKVESYEIRFKVGWDKWSEDQSRQSIGL